jgi:hypothetical protein
MGQSPFRKHAVSADQAGASQRRSTRVDFACPIVVSGRDASGQSFREETETSTVSLHGCKLPTRHQVLVGMMVSIECAATQASAKGVCVHVFDPQAGDATHEIAVQLLKPQNMWGLENPPPDWEAVARELAKGGPTLVRAEGASAVPESVGRPTPSSVEVAPQGGQPVRAEAVPPAALPDTETQLAILEQRAAQLMESVLQILSTQADECVRATVDTLRQQVAALVKEAEEQIKKRAEKTYEDVEGSLFGLRADLAEQLSQRTEQIVANAEEALRARVGEMFAKMLKPPPQK